MLSPASQKQGRTRGSMSRRESKEKARLPATSRSQGAGLWPWGRQFGALTAKWNQPRSRRRQSEGGRGREEFRARKALCSHLILLQTSENFSEESTNGKKKADKIVARAPRRGRKLGRQSLNGIISPRFINSSPGLDRGKKNHRRKKEAPLKRHTPTRDLSSYNSCRTESSKKKKKN